MQYFPYSFTWQNLSTFNTFGIVHSNLVSQEILLNYLKFGDIDT